MRVVDFKNGQPIKVLTDLYVVNVVYNQGFLVDSVTSSNTRDISLFLTGEQWKNDVCKIATKYQVGLFNEEFCRIDFHDDSGVSYFLINEDEIAENSGFKLDDTVFELCSRFEFKYWMENNVKNSKFDLSSIE